MSYKLLQLGPNTQVDDWTFHPGSIFLSLLFEIVELWISCFDFDWEKSLVLDQAFDLCCKKRFWNGCESMVKMVELRWES